MEQVLGESLAQRRFSLTLIGVFAGLSLLLAAVGIARECCRTKKSPQQIPDICQRR